jgi:hypothetical protein
MAKLSLLHLFGACLALAGSIFMTLIVVSAVLEGGDVNPLGYLGAAVGICLGILLAIKGFQAAHEVPPRVSSRSITPGFSLRRRDGKRVRTVPMEDVVNACACVVEGYNGLTVTLSDGTKFFLAQSSFPRDGVKILGDLSRRFGQLYQEELERILLSGESGFRLAQVKVRKLEGSAILFNSAIRKWSGGETKRVDRVDISQVRGVATPYVGKALMIVLTDGTRFLVPEKDARKALLLEAAGGTGVSA